MSETVPAKETNAFELIRTPLAARQLILLRHLPANVGWRRLRFTMAA